ncbi:MAG: acetolactate synthase large subunit [Ignisphaera sp.]|nr:acetolactate synthase large subunit [Ignisphaera sp.]MCX8167445.1 acetolactate synthase large subunit [Ignisphaera sp.]MDW8084691.1 acetolactate synthase large subunit [Ignisphaera sp.]
MKGADLTAKTLKELNVKIIFGIPGLSNMTLYDTLVDYVKSGEMRLILMRHEQGAAHAADGYARALGKPGVCTATSGPGALNLVTGLATAYWDSSPVVAITGQVPRASIGKMSFQEADIPGVVQNIVKFVIQIRNVGDIPIWLYNAFHIAVEGRPGPVVVDIPRDIFSEKVVNGDIRFGREAIKGFRRFPIYADPILIKKAVEILVNAERPLILVGSGAVTSMATDEIVTLADMLIAPIVSTLLGKSAVPNDYPLYIGMMGYYGRAEANTAFLESDVVLVVGARLSDRTVTSYKDIVDSRKKFIVINIDPTDVERLPINVDVALIGDAKAILRKLIDSLMSIGVKFERSNWIRRIYEFKDYYSHFYYVDEDGVGLKPWRALKTIRGVLPRDAIVTTGVGQHQMWCGVFWEALEPRTFITSGGMGTMGFGLPAAIGAKVAQPNRVVVDLDGDGSFLMTMNNLSTAVDEHIPIIVVLFDNRTLGLVRQVQDLFFGGRVISVDFGSTIDYIKIAEGLGALGFDAQTYEDLVVAIKRSMRENMPSVVRIPIKRDELSLPTLPPGGSLREMILHDPRKGD